MSLINDKISDMEEKGKNYKKSPVSDSNERPAFLWDEELKALAAEVGKRREELEKEEAELENGRNKK